MNELELNRIKLEQDFIKTLGGDVFSPHWKEHTEEALKNHDEHCKSTRIKNVKEYGMYKDTIVEWYQCGCQNVINSPVGNSYWFTKDQQDERFLLVRTIIDRNKALNRMLW